MFFINPDEFKYDIDDSMKIKPYNRQSFIEYVSLRCPKHVTLNERERYVIYWHLYLKNYSKERLLSNKLLPHPEITERDSSNIYKYTSNVYYNMVYILSMNMAILSYTYYRYRYIHKMHNKYTIYASFIAVPISTICLSYYLQHAYIDNRLRSLDMHTKYKIPMLDEYVHSHRDKIDQFDIILMNW